VRRLDEMVLKPYFAQPALDVRDAAAKIETLVGELLPEGVDEGTPEAVDGLIRSWTASRIAAIDSQYLANLSAIDRMLVSVEQQAVQAAAAHDADVRSLEYARLDYEEARRKLGEAVPGHEEERS
jgi:hypothetical protein